MLVDKHYARHMSPRDTVTHILCLLMKSKSPANPLLIEIHHCIISAPDLLRWAHHAWRTAALRTLLQKYLMMEESFLLSCPQHNLSKKPPVTLRQFLICESPVGNRWPRVPFLGSLRAKFIVMCRTFQEPWHSPLALFIFSVSAFIFRKEALTGLWEQKSYSFCWRTWRPPGRKISCACNSH